MGRPERDPAPDAERPGRRILRSSPARPSTGWPPGPPAGRSGRSRSGASGPTGSGGGASRGGGVAWVEVRGSGCRWGGKADDVGGPGRVVAEEIRVAETAVPLATLGVEDPELRPSPRRPVAAAGHERLGPLADDVAPEPDPPRRWSSRRRPVDFGHRRRQPGGQARWLEGDEERLGPPGEPGQATQPLGDLGRRRARRGAAGDRSRGRRPSGRRGASRRSTGPRRASRGSGRRASPGERRGRRPRPGRAPGRDRARRRSRRRPGPRRRAAGRGSWRRSSERPQRDARRRGSPPGPTIASRAGKPVRTIRSTPVRGSLAGEGASADGSSGGSAGSGAVASAPITRGAAAPHRVWRDARAAETSGERLAIGRSD